MIFASLNVHRHYYHHLIGMTNSYDFSGDAVTFLGFVGVVSTLVIMVSVFKSYWTSPYRK